MRISGVLVAMWLLLGAHGAAAASFNCAKAANAVERSICADPKLSALDEKALASYSAALEALGLADADFRNSMSELLLKGHQEWTAARDRCGAATNCMLGQYLRRIAVLGFHPDPQSASPVDSFVGRYGTIIDPERELVIMRASGDAVLARVTVNAKDWTCDFNGIGRLDKDGRLRITRPDFDKTAGGDHTLILSPTRLGVAITHALKSDDVSARYCGVGGSLEQPFPRRS
jgi:uncharacterized protein